MKPNLLLIFVLCAFLGIHETAAAETTIQPSNDDMRSGFANPPQAAKLRCYWWWLNGNTTEETITNDLTEMSRKGFGGVLLVDANGSNQNGNENSPAGPTYGSPGWVKLYLHALKVAADLHLEVTLSITSGWNLGSPDVKPAQASKLLTWSRTLVAHDGFNGVLPTPSSKNGFYAQIAVLAYPLSHGAPLPGKAGDRRSPIRGLRFKTASEETGISMQASEPLLADAPAVAGEEDTYLGSVLNLSDKVDSSGHLHWQPPTGSPWEIMRVGYTDSDARVSTASGAWQGLAIDYLDTSAFDSYWDHSVAPLLEVARPYLKSTLVTLATDSWEVGGTNWTGRFREEFQRRRGYDPVPYLPVVAGRIVQDRETSNRFLNDLRRTVGDLITEHYDRFAARASEYGLGVQAESGGPHGAPVDGLETYRASTVPQTEYWAESNEHRSADQERFFTKEVACAANIYGKHFAAEEGMTSIGPHWSESLAADLKPTFDRASTEGMNRLVWHEFTSSPPETGLPGNEYFAGTHINPKVTWWQQSTDFFLYLNRVQFLLQRGYAFNDVLYFYGDHVPNFVRLKSDDPAKALPGYDYDVTSEDALLHSLKLADGAIVSPAGNRYALLTMPKSRRMSIASLERIAEYLRNGGSVSGPAPITSTGIVDSETTRKFADLVWEIWGDCAQPVRTYGAGKVFCSIDARKVMNELNMKPDFESTSTTLDYVHRRDGSVDTYFVRNGSSQQVDALASFRVSGRVPELWNAIDGSIEMQAFFREREGVTQLPLHLPPYGSIFVVFAKPAHAHVEGVHRNGLITDSINVAESANGGFSLANAPAGNYTLRLTDGRELTVIQPPSSIVDLPASRWTIRFQKGRGAPIGLQHIEQFKSWSEDANPGIHFFSGTATYGTAFAFHPKSDERVVLRLSALHEIATVRLNGEALGTIWASPYELDLTGRLKDGQNRLELDVSNLWPNRIIGDAQPSPTRTYTHTNIRKYKFNTPLLPSGLTGPVVFEIKPTSGTQAASQAASLPRTERP